MTVRIIGPSNAHKTVGARQAAIKRLRDAEARERVLGHGVPILYWAPSKSYRCVCVGGHAIQFYTVSE